MAHKTIFYEKIEISFEFGSDTIEPFSDFAEFTCLYF